MDWWYLLLLVLLNIVGFIAYDLVRYGRLLMASIMTIPLPLDSATEEEAEGERVTFLSSDGVPLEGKWIKSPKGNGRTVIFCHEYGKSMNSWKHYAGFLPHHGFNVFTFNFRSASENHTDSKPSSKQWPSSLEHRDLLGALNYLWKRPDTASDRIALFGISKGGGVALHTASKSKTVRAVVVDGIYSMIDIILHYAYRLVPILAPRYVFEVLPSKLLFYFYAYSILKVYGWKVGYNFLHVERAIECNQHPVFFIHGEQDSYFRVKQVKMMFDRAKGYKEFWTVAGARHNEGVSVAPWEYEQRVVQFLERYA